MIVDTKNATSRALTLPRQRSTRTSISLTTLQESESRPRMSTARAALTRALGPTTPRGIVVTPEAARSRSLTSRILLFARLTQVRRERNEEEDSPAKKKTDKCIVRHYNQKAMPIGRTGTLSITSRYNFIHRYIDTYQATQRCSIDVLYSFSSTVM